MFFFSRSNVRHQRQTDVHTITTQSPQGGSYRSLALAFSKGRKVVMVRKPNLQDQTLDEGRALVCLPKIFMLSLVLQRSNHWSEVHSTFCSYADMMQLNLCWFYKTGSDRLLCISVLLIPFETFKARTAIMECSFHIPNLSFHYGKSKFDFGFPISCIFFCPLVDLTAAFQFRIGVPKFFCRWNVWQVHCEGSYDFSP